MIQLLYLNSKLKIIKGGLHEVFNKMTATIAPETIEQETAATLFLYLKKFYTINENSYTTLDDLSEVHTELMQTIFPLSDEKMFKEMEEVVAKIFVKGEIGCYPFNSNYLQPKILLAAGEANETERFFELIVNNIKSGGDFQKGMGSMVLIAMVGGDNPKCENWRIHLDDTINLFTEILLERENLPDYRGTDDENYCTAITGNYGSGLFDYVEVATINSRKKIKTPKKSDIFKRNLIPWLEAKKK